MPLFNLLLGLQGHWALMEQWSPCKWKIKSIRRCQAQVSQAFRLMAQRLQMDLQTFLLLPRDTGSSSRGAISIMSTLPAASTQCYPCLSQWLPQTAFSPSATGSTRLHRAHHIQPLQGTHSTTGILLPLWPACQKDTWASTNWPAAQKARKE